MKVTTNVHVAINNSTIIIMLPKYIMEFHHLLQKNILRYTYPCEMQDHYFLDIPCNGPPPSADLQYRSIITSFLHAWYHAVFRVVCRGIYISTRCDVELLTQGMEFTHNGNVTFSQDVVVLTKLSNWQDSSCL